MRGTNVPKEEEAAQLPKGFVGVKWDRLFYKPERDSLGGGIWKRKIKGVGVDPQETGGFDQGTSSGSN